MDLTLTYLPGDRLVNDLVADQDPHSGLLAVTCRPGRGDDRLYAVTQTMLRGFGVRDDVSGHGRSLAEDQNHVRARLRSYGTRRVALRHAENLGERPEKVLDLFLEMLRGEGAGLALACDDNTGERLAAWVEANGGQVCPDEADLTAQFAPSPRSSSGPSEADFPSGLPRVDFYLFRARCRDLLDAHSFEVVDNLYVSSARRVLAEPFLDSTDASRRLTQWAAACTTTAQVITLIRGAQAASFRSGSLLKVNLDAYLRLVEDDQHRPLSDAELLALRAYRNTTISAAVVLADAGLSAAEAVSVPLGALAADAATIEGTPVPFAGREFLRTHAALRRLDGADDGEALLTCKKRYVLEHRRTVAAELGIPSVPKQAPFELGQQGRWDKEIGASLQPLRGAAIPGATSRLAS